MCNVVSGDLFFRALKKKRLSVRSMGLAISTTFVSFKYAVQQYQTAAVYNYSSKEYKKRNKSTRVRAHARELLRVCVKPITTINQRVCKRKYDYLIDLIIYGENLS